MVSCNIQMASYKEKEHKRGCTYTILFSVISPWIMNSHIVVSIYLLLVEAYQLASCQDENGRTVQTPMGQIRGSILKSRSGKTIYTFRGIPFAQHPVGELRFKPPQPLSYYTETVDASEEGPACPQPTRFNFTIGEDCLRLNVYSAHLPQGRQNPRSPVLVYFHAGGFYLVSGISIYEGPQYLLDRDLVLVTVNYRLASLGFMSTGTKESPGNNGLKDQVQALRWVKRNIASFGGDPDTVTICGYSAGGISVGLHMLSPMSKGLFHRAIAMSGAPTSNVFIPSHQLHLAKKQAQLLNCPTASPQLIVDCLKSKSAIDISQTLNAFYEINLDPVLIWLPVVELDFGQERFLTGDPTDLVKAGKFYSVPLLIGITALEFAGRAFSVLRNETTLENYNLKWKKLAPISFLYERDTERSSFISQELKYFYLGDEPMTNDNETARALGQLYGDGLISFGVHRFARLMAQESRNAVYYYKFSYKGRYSHFYYPGTTEPIGPVHHDDLLYLFNISIRYPGTTLDAPESFMVDRITTMWVNFANCGNPTPSGYIDPVMDNFRWPRLTENNKLYVDNGEELVIKQAMFEERFKLWERLFPF